MLFFSGEGVFQTLRAKTDLDYYYCYTTSLILQVIGKDSDAGKDGRQEKRHKQKMKWLDSITDSMAMNLSKLKEIVKHTEAWCAAVHWMAKSWPPLSN